MSPFSGLWTDNTNLAQSPSLVLLSGDSPHSLLTGCKSSLSAILGILKHPGLVLDPGVLS